MGIFVALMLVGVFNMKEAGPGPDIPLCLGVLKHRAPLARGGHLPANFFLRWIFAYVVQF